MRTYCCPLPNTVEQLEALARRLPPAHRKQTEIQASLKKELAGIKGQNAIQFPLRFLSIEPPPIVIHNPRLSDEHGFFEIDVLVLCQQFIAILEIKNWYGTLFVDGEQQIIRVGDDGVEEGMANPFSQAKLQKHRLGKWLDHQGFCCDIPILPLVIIAFPTTILKSLTPNTEIPSSLLHCHRLSWKISCLLEHYPKQAMSMKQLSMLSETISRSHVVKELRILDKYGIQKEMLRGGVFCPACHSVPMARVHGSWQCPACKNKSQTAHMQALRDYQLLLGSDISNEDARLFLKISSSDLARRILMESSIRSVGKGKGRRYELGLDVHS